MTKEALKLALEALEAPWNAPYVDGCDLALGKKVKAITAIKEALAQPEQKPVPVKRMMGWVEGLKRQSDNGRYMHIPSGLNSGTCWELANELEQFINTTPPQRKPLSDEEVHDAVRESDLDWHQGWTLDNDEPNRFISLARAIEAAHGIKGEA